MFQAQPEARAPGATYVYREPVGLRAGLMPQIKKIVPKPLLPALGHGPVKSSGYQTGFSDLTFTV